MASRSETLAFDRGVRPIARIVFPEKAKAVLSFEPDPQVRKRIEVLASKSTEGRLTSGERAEYEGYVRANNFIAILQGLARKLSKTSS